MDLKTAFNRTRSRRSLPLTVCSVLALLLAACGPADTDETIAAEETSLTMTDTPVFYVADDNPAPAAEKRPVEIEQLGRTRVDNFAWLRDAGWQEVLRDPAMLDDDIRAHLQAPARIIWNEGGYYKYRRR